MCGRFVSTTPPDELAHYFGAEHVADGLAAHHHEAYNVAPTSDVYVVYTDGAVRTVDAFRWGLVPRWATDPKVGQRMINARAETLATKGAFKAAFGHRRCIVPADGFYEWRRVAGRSTKVPMFVHRPDGEPYAFAGLWERWRPPDNSTANPRGASPSEPPWLRSCTIVTTAANRTMAPVHDRMPAMLPPRAWDRWLDPELTDLEQLQEFLVPAPDGLVVMHPVAPAVGNVRNEGPGLIEPVPEDPPGLF